ncbi:WASH complex subunit 2-like [Dreissena polymorpha]|uniref:WASH complex subunit 2-like n=1 Tax=Dreissena polymorpha TaxID=45954 RepID=UPI002263C841|nr:WASH complex subunit 2-like [Dreissena polymorpha]
MANATPPDLSNSETTAAFKQVDRTWERAWTLKEMRQGASHWSLAGDAGLLLYLQEFSQKLISRTHEIEKEVENLVHDSKLTTVRVNNVFNEFMMLANTQFVENRVYEDESDQVETQPEEKKQESQEKTREQREAELVPKVSEAIRLGVDVIERAFEKLETNIDQSDSEEDESYRVDPILEAKDPYLERSLPYLIGTPQFLNDDNVGLREVSDDDESDHGEISESEESESEEDKKKQQDSYSDSESDSDGEVPVSRPAKPMFPADASEESDSDGDLFGASERRTKPEDSSATPSEGESGEEHNTQVPAAPLDFASELARKLGGAPPKPSSPQAGTGAGDEEKGPGQKEHKKKKKEVTKPAKTEEEDLFGEAGESEDEDLFGGAHLRQEVNRNI